MILLDSNIFLEVEALGSRKEVCKKLLAEVKDGHLESSITDFHVDSIAIVMENHGKKWKDVATFLNSLHQYEGLRIHKLNLANKIRATSYMRENKLDFDDALAAQALEELSTRTISSYDDDFDSVDWIERKTPRDILEEE